MNGNILYKTFFSCCFLWTAFAGFAQSATTVRISADRNRILIGEPILLTLEADIPESEPIRFFTIDTIPHFEIEQRQKIDSSDTREGTTLRQLIRITSFDSGHWVIPPFVLAEGVATDSIPVDVVFSDFNPEQDYHDVRDIVDVNPREEEKSRWWLWYAAGGALLAVAVAFYFFLRKRKPVVPPPVPAADPYDEAMRKLERLEKPEPEVKLYYSELTDIFRIYVLKRKGIHSLQETTVDLVRRLKAIGLTGEQHESLSGVLQMSDLVKFARYVPSGEDNRKALETVRAAIRAIEQLK